MTIAKILDLYARGGRSLIGNGLDEAALSLPDAKVALELFASRRWRILGGDVYCLSEQQSLESTYENWSYDGNDFGQSVDVARNYLAYLAQRDVYIVFVVDECR
ncbi:Imm40 family immunity protein [Robbsia sp. KACC 23696]|uniref:Imm40 family immunity protein n=1 Tax=Robbsia sp. KACC 23696 TaxID=3149231 RepID=UPI00325ADF2D